MLIQTALMPTGIATSSEKFEAPTYSSLSRVLVDNHRPTLGSQIFDFEKLSLGSLARIF
jgi:hypothetical protein